MIVRPGEIHMHDIDMDLKNGVDPSCLTENDERDHRGASNRTGMEE